MKNAEWLRYARRVCRAALGADHLLAKDVSVQSVHIGSAYGGWSLALLPLMEVARPVVFSFGLGDDITFDIGMSEQFNAKVYGFDPSPTSHDWIAANGKPDSMDVFSFGLSNLDGDQVFTARGTDRRGNFSTRANKDRSINGKVMRYGSILAMLDVGCPDVLKLDIEGSEYDVLPEILAQPDLPSQILIEFHHRVHGIALNETFRSVAALRKSGYRIFSVSSSGQEFGFIHKRSLTKSMALE